MVAPVPTVRIFGSLYAVVNFLSLSIKLLKLSKPLPALTVWKTVVLAKSIEALVVCVDTTSASYSMFVAALSVSASAT